ncbi:ABC transporter ATP-binding protein [Massilia litorea]|uniref:ABC transporter ATP-binding protein n=1 Tax=Massilia litorea TaxID=2769491 RepID=A0A7L9U1L3_9BURK|nr:ABC transporter ATP-binding protein [Massilia litorea]QOL48913.1 ABC transporter ATP-binding protein [Massilia litorea]
MTTSILQVNDLHVAYGKVEALHGLNIRVGAGQIVTVIGPNGAGKSTMLNAIAGAQVANASTRGAVLLRGADVGSYPVEQRVAQGMSLVPESRDLFTTMSVEDNLLLGAYTRYRRREKDYAATLESVYELFPRLRERRMQAAGTMSGGERQMVALGRALMARPTLLMLDEPSLGLAPLIVKEIFRVIVRLKETGVGILLVEQNARAALQAADYGYVLETGEVVMEGPAAQLANDPKVIDTYLGLNKKSA